MPTITCQHRQTNSDGSTRYTFRTDGTAEYVTTDWSSSNGGTCINQQPIVEVGKNVSDFKVGERIAVLPSIACGECASCRSHGNNVLCLNSPGSGMVGFAEYASVPTSAVPIQVTSCSKLTTAPATIVRHNNMRSVTLNGAPAPGYSSGEAIAAMERVARANLPPGYTFQWSGTAQQEKEAASQTGFVLALAVLFAYLFLVALYESLALPVAALLSVVVGLFGALGALWLTGLANNIYAQIGIVVLIALAAKNAILVIEVAMQERLSGRDPVTAATSAAGQRFRAVIMTSFAFILGLVPLVIASGAGAATQRAVGTAVFGGMLAAACLGIFVIPGLYVMFEKIRIRFPTLLRRMFRQLKRSR